MRYLCLLIVMTPLVLMAADPVGRITSSGPLTLDGKAVPATAASSLALVAGDEVATSSSGATIFFADRSRAMIAPNSRVKLEPYGSSVALRVLSGTAELRRAKSSRVTLIAPIVSAPKPAVGGHFFPPALLVGAATAAGVAVSFATMTASPETDKKPPMRSKRCPDEGDCAR